MNSELGPLELESETQKKVSDSLSKIEVALSEWDASKRKPKELDTQVRNLKRFYALLSAWERQSLRGPRNDEAAMERLHSFVDICRQMEAAGIG